MFSRRAVKAVVAGFFSIFIANSPMAAGLCGECPQFYCKNVELANQLKQQKKAKAELRGLPKRLSALFDALGDCEGCVSKAPDWPHLIIQYDGEAMSAHYGSEINSYTSSRPWSAADEYNARQKMIAGLVTGFHITLGSKPCRCCSPDTEKEYNELASNEFKALLNDPLWNEGLGTHASTTLSYKTQDAARNIPGDLENIAPIDRVRAPQPGRLEDFKKTAPVRVVQVQCPACQGLADSYNQTGRELDKLNLTLAGLNRDIAYEEAVTEYAQAGVDALATVAKTTKIRQQMRDFKSQRSQAYGNLNPLRNKLDQAQSKAKALRAQLDSTLQQLKACEGTSCQPEPTEPLEPLEVYTLGLPEFAFTNGASECPMEAGTIAITSNNGNPLEVTEVSDSGKIAKHIDQAVVDNNTPNPLIKNTVNCETGKPKRLKGEVSARITDTVTGESLLTEFGARGRFHSTPKTTNDPNHAGTIGSGLDARAAQWTPIETKCAQCSKLVAQYNQTMTMLFKVRNRLANTERLRQNPKNNAYVNFTLPGLTSAPLDPESPEGKKTIKKLVELLDRFDQMVEHDTASQLALEKQAKNLQWAIAECELQQCGKKGKSKIKQIKVGGEVTTDNFQPEISKLFNDLGAKWEGPFTTSCAPCKPIVAQLNAVPGWLTRAQFELSKAQRELQYQNLVPVLAFAEMHKKKVQKLTEQVAKAQADLDALLSFYKKLIADLSLCEARYCPYEGADVKNAIPGAAITNCSNPDGNESIVVGPNSEVGSGADFRAKAKQKMAGAATKAITGLLGIGGGGGGKDQGPVTYKDPVKKKHKTKVKDKKPKRELVTGAAFTDQGLLVSNDIKKAPGKGTFQHIWLENPRGWRLYPLRHLLYQLWKEWKLTVSWTKDTYVDGEHVAHEEGGWSESWKELVYEEERIEYREEQDDQFQTSQPGLSKYAPVVWGEMGFNTAVSGARGLGSLFAVTPEMLAAEPLDLFVHVTEPKKDPVTTRPYHFRLSLNNEGAIETEYLEPQQLAIEEGNAKKPCPPAGTVIKTDSGAGVFDNLEVDPSLDAQIGGNIDAGSLEVGSNSTLDVGGDIRDGSIDNLEADPGLDAEIGGNIGAGNLGVGGSEALDVGGDVRDQSIDNLEVDPSLDAEIGGNVDAGSLDVGSSSTLDVGGDSAGLVDPDLSSSRTNEIVLGGTQAPERDLVLGLPSKRDTEVWSLTSDDTNAGTSSAQIFDAILKKSEIADTYADNFGVVDKKKILLDLEQVRSEQPDDIDVTELNETIQTLYRQIGYAEEYVKTIEQEAADLRSQLTAEQASDFEEYKQQKALREAEAANDPLEVVSVAGDSNTIGSGVMSWAEAYEVLNRFAENIDYGKAPNEVGAGKFDIDREAVESMLTDSSSHYVEPTIGEKGADTSTARERLHSILDESVRNSDFHTVVHKADGKRMVSAFTANGSSGVGPAISILLTSPVTIDPSIGLSLNGESAATHNYRELNNLYSTVPEATNLGLSPPSFRLFFDIAIDPALVPLDAFAVRTLIPPGLDLDKVNMGDAGQTVPEAGYLVDYWGKNDFDVEWSTDYTEVKLTLNPLAEGPGRVPSTFKPRAGTSLELNPGSKNIYDLYHDGFDGNWDLDDTKPTGGRE